MKRPSSWDDITVDQFMELKSLDYEDQRDELTMISILLDIPYSSLEDLDIMEFQKYTSGLDFVQKPLNNKPTETIIIKQHQFYKLPFTKLTLGEFVDLEHYFTNDYIQNLPKILSVLYRRKLRNGNINLFPEEFEPYGSWVDYRSNLFLTTPINGVFGIITEYLNYRKNIFEAYSGLFDDPETDEELEEDDEQPKEEKKSNKWGWATLIYRVANGNTLDYERATNTNLLLALNMLSLQKELGITPS